MNLTRKYFFLKRDLKTMFMLPGVVVGDMGPKIGLNGVDNGFLTLNNVRIPRENLLNKTGDVTVDGNYVTPFKVRYLIFIFHCLF